MYSPGASPNTAYPFAGAPIVGNVLSALEWSVSHSSGLAHKKLDGDAMSSNWRATKETISSWWRDGRPLIALVLWSPECGERGKWWEMRLRGNFFLSGASKR